MAGHDNSTEDSASAETQEQPAVVVRLLGCVARVFAMIVLLGMVAWAAAALNYSTLPTTLRPIAAVVMAVGGLWAVLRRKHPWVTRGVLLGVWLVVALYWMSIKPSNDRDWVTDVAVLPTVQFEGDKVTIENVRNITYRSADDYTPAYDRRTYDLGALHSVGFVVSYFSTLQGIAHTFLTFGFSDGQYVSISIEVRKELGESYSPITGLFKQFEITYIIGDERDVIGSRTTYRNEDVYLYPMALNKADIRSLFEDMLVEVDKLTKEPAFYNTLYPNCTTSIVQHLRNIRPGSAQFDIRMLLNGFSDQLAFERGALATDLSFDEARQQFRINALARAAGDAPDFSQQIRIRWPDELR